MTQGRFEVTKANAAAFTLRKFIDRKTFTYIDADKPLGDSLQQWRSMCKVKMRAMFAKALLSPLVDAKSKDAINEVLSIMEQEAN